MVGWEGPLIPEGTRGRGGSLVLPGMIDGHVDFMDPRTPREHFRRAVGRSGSRCDDGD